ncbi:hypothetical protein [Brevibacillus reuszeri]|uniref:hypothetical protein n=1 Tax=Brevibacillus reuszeri TaxID=54915 RepID=UPI000CCC10F1|nr:hypothetical protein [Brevibacillus reuszeri]
MATVTGTLKMFDAMSRPLRQITNSMNMMIKTMEQMQSATGKNINVDRTLALAKKQLQSAEASIGREIEKSTNLQQKFNRSVQEGDRGMSGMINSLKGMAAAYLTFEGARALFSSTLGKALERQQLVDTMAARMGSAEAALNVYERIRKQALAANEDVNKSLSNVQAFMSNTMNAGQLEELNMLAMRLSKLNPAEGIEGAAFAMKELLSGDYTSIVERFNMGRSLIQNSAALKAGKMGNMEGFIKGMDELLDKQQMTEESFRRMLDSPASRWQRVVNTFKDNMTQAGLMGMKAFSPVIELINKGFDSGKFQSFFSGLGAGMQVFASIVERISTFIYDHLDIIKRLLVSIGFVIAAVTTQWAVGWAVANWPILAVIAAITTLLWILDKLGITTDEVIGYVAGAFYGLGAAVSNQLAFMNNQIVAFAEFLANIFNHPVYAIQKLFYDMVRNVVGYFESMINTIVDGINTTIERINAISKASIAVIPRVDQSFIDQFKPEMPTGATDLSAYRWDYKNIGEQMKNGYSAGFNLANKFQKTFDKMQVFSVGPGMNAAASSNIANIGKVGEVGKIRDSVDISSEDLKIMRELAEQRWIQNNTVTLTPTIRIEGTTITKEADADTIIARINQALEEQIASSGRAVLSV